MRVRVELGKKNIKWYFFPLCEITYEKVKVKKSLLNFIPFNSETLILFILSNYDWSRHS